ncbi:BTAD domain-containing putative transcriptional regulator [Gordonia sp. X0973]|uniref:BTAD domain-containing putative transcriptional regulator n=1 Tax=Gordonia sp. X0973 TaxID=2742602 RepID=UPI0026574927|nr:BTAD domain-containing putative transcriptional regulator [Gordonia sp. X0973]
MAREYLVLGPLAVVVEGNRVELGSPKQRAVLGALLVARGAVVSVERLIDTVWPDDPPEAATTSLQAYISNLRRLLRADSGEPSPIERVAGGYRLDVGDDGVDLVEFAEWARDARAARDDGRWDDALRASEAAAALWRGELLGGEFDPLGWLGAEAMSLRETVAAVGEIHVAALLAGGDTGAALAETVGMRAADPFRERAAWLHMVALYRAGRAAEALEVYGSYLRSLDDELGLEPGAELVELHGAILRHDPAIAAWPRPPHWTGAVSVAEPDDTPAASAVEPVGPRGDGPVDVGVPLIGREDEVAQLRVAVTHGSGTSWAVLIGPAGIGKTRLAQETAAISAAAGRPAVWIRCPDAEGTPAWWPLRQLCRALDADPDDVLAVPDGAGADTARFAVYERVQHLVERSAPFTLIVDDAQWADPMTLGLLSYLTTVVAEAPVSVVATVREGEGGQETERFVAAVARAGGAVITVGRLGRADVATLVRAVADEDLAPDSLDALVRRTEGNPLFVSEFARLPAEQRAAEMVPDAVRSVLDRRLGSLDPAVQEIIGHAAVIGEEVDVALLVAVCGRDLDDVADALDEAVDERILVADPVTGRTRFAHALLRDQALTTIRPLRRCRIHLRVADVLRDSTASDATPRRAAHLLDAMPVADAGDVVDACRLAARDAVAHWDSESAARWLDAALKTRESVDPNAPDVDDLLVGALTAHARAGHLQEVLHTVEERLNRAIETGRSDTAGRLASVLIRAGGAWPWIGPHVENEGLRFTLERSAQAVADDPGSLARVLAAAAIGETYARDASVPDALLERADALAADLSDDAITADVLLARMITYSGVAPYAEVSLAWAQQMRGLRYPGRDVDEVIVDTVLTMATMVRGDVAATEELTRRAIVGSERLRLPILRAQLRWMQASLAVWHGGFEQAKEHFHIAIRVHEDTQLYVAGSGALAMMALATEQGMLGEFIDTGGLTPTEWARALLEQFSDNQVMTLFAAGVASVAGDQGDRELAETMVNSWLADHRTMIWTTLGQAVMLAHVVHDLGLDEYAPALRDRLMPFRDCIATVGQVGCIGPVALPLAGLCFQLGDTDSADEILAQAMAIAERGDGEPSMLRGRLLHARMHPRAPGREQALVDVERRARELGIDPVAEAARELLAE